MGSAGVSNLEEFDRQVLLRRKKFITSNNGNGYDKNGNAVLVDSADGAACGVVAIGVGDAFPRASLNDVENFHVHTLLPDQHDSAGVIKRDVPDWVNYQKRRRGTHFVSLDGILTPVRRVFVGDGPVVQGFTGFDPAKHGHMYGLKDLVLIPTTDKNGVERLIPFAVCKDFGKSNSYYFEIDAILSERLLGETYMDWKIHAPVRILENCSWVILKRIWERMESTTISTSEKAEILKALQRFDYLYPPCPLLLLLCYINLIYLFDLI